MLSFLENVYIGSDRNLEDFRFPVQYVNRPHLNFRGFCGTIASGIVRRGDSVMALPSRKTTRIKEIVTMDGNLEEAFAPMSVTLTLAEEIDVSRGEMIVRPGNIPSVDHKFEAVVVWMNETQLVPGKQYLFKHTARTVPGSISTMRYRIDVNTLHRQDAPTLGLNDIGRCAISLSQPLMFDAFRRNRSTGSFIIIDRLSNLTVGAGMILDRHTSSDRPDKWDFEPTGVSLSHEFSQVSAEERAARFGQQAVTVFLSGVPGAGKSTTAYALERYLFDQGRAATVLDGQNLRLGLSRDLGFTADARSENVRRTAEVARLVNEAGMIAIVSQVAPEESVRQRAADVISRERFILVHLTADPNVLAQRQATADAAPPDDELRYEPPSNPDLVLETDKLSPADCVHQIANLLTTRGVLTP
jgi:bifunctional enzyme CysN/CysC